ncbi:MAG: tetratricopeptide repeat protein [Ignavibacteriales bacterium]|nr:tetratricopeptide repeat protein [Ignavibacteriales bacterium]
MNTRFFYLLTGLFCIAALLNAQVPSVQLKIKEKSGFLGMGGPRTVRIDLSNESRQQPLTSDNVNSGQYFYFLVTPVEDWQLDQDFVKDQLAKVNIYQNENKILIAWKGELITGDKISILIGFPKTVKLNQLFLFQCPVDEAMSQAEFKVPTELWPGYTLITNLSMQAEAAASAKQYKPAIGIFEQILSNNNLQIFPQYDESKNKRTKCFDGLCTETSTSFNSVATNAQLDLKSRIAQVDGFKPSFKFLLDSLPRTEWNIGSLDPTVAPILDQCRNAISRIAEIRDSLQRVLDDQNVRWIIEGSSTSKNGYLYAAMIEALASAFSSLNFADTVATDLKVKIPEDLQARLAKYNITESYETFIRICNERYQTHLPIFQIDFLPNLKKDTVSFSLPYYSMLKAVNDYYYGNFTSAKEEIFRIFRICFEPEINSRFDMMRVVIANREQNISQEVMKMLDEAAQFERAKDLQNALDKYRQVTLIAPNFAYGHFTVGKYYTRTGEPIRAIYSYQRAYQIDTLYLSAYRESYNLYMRQSNFKEIISFLTTAIAKGNDYWEINFDLGIAYLGDADPARAIQSFEHALALNPKSYKTNILLGKAHQDVKNYQKAREYFNNAIGLDPTKQEAVDFLTKLNDLQRTGK